MGRIIVKVSRSRDLYVEWSSIVEAPTCIGTRAEMLAHIGREVPDGYYPKPGNSPEDRMARADQTGTSALYPDEPPYDGAWDDAGFIVEQRGWLPRSNLEQFIDTWSKHGPEAAYALLHPFENTTESA